MMGQRRPPGGADQAAEPNLTPSRCLPRLVIRRIMDSPMKQVLALPDSAQIGLAQSILDAAGIPCEVRNDAVHQAIPGMPFCPELWVIRDEDYEEARRLVRSVRAGPSPSREDT